MVYLVIAIWIALGFIGAALQYWVMGWGEGHYPLTRFDMLMFLICAIPGPIMFLFGIMFLVMGVGVNLLDRLSNSTFWSKEL